tara:strand:- start:104 stop:982 length:879 start_codon:yes stop_codon:yes gene_type:complete
MKIDTLVLSGGGPSGIAYFGLFKSLFEKDILNENLDGIKEIITTSIGILTAVSFILKLPIEVGKNIILKYDIQKMINVDNIQIDDILVDFGLFETTGIRNIIQSILKNFKGVEDISLKELYDISNIKLTVKVFNATKKQLEYISYETNPDLSILTLSQMTTAIPFFFKPVKYKDCIYVDGGMRGHFPIEECKSDNYLGLFIMGGAFPEKSEIVQLFPILEYLYSLMINQDKIVYDIIDNKSNPRIIFLDVSYGLNFEMSHEEKIRIIDKGYQTCNSHIESFTEFRHLEKDKV